MTALELVELSKRTGLTVGTTDFNVAKGLIEIVNGTSINRGEWQAFQTNETGLLYEFRGKVWCVRIRQWELL